MQNRDIAYFEDGLVTSKASLEPWALSQSSKMSFGSDPNRQLRCLDTHPLLEGHLAVAYNDGSVEWRNSETSPFSRVASATRAVDFIRWAPRATLTLALTDSDRALVYEFVNNTTWKGKTLSGHGSDVTGLSWFSDGSKLATCSLDNKIIVWEWSRSKQLYTFEAPSWVQCCNVDPLGRYLAAGCDDSSLLVWQISNQTEHVRRKISEGGRMLACEWSPDGKYLAWSNFSGRTGIIERSNPKSDLVVFKGFGKEKVTSVRFAPTLLRTSNSVVPLLALCSIHQIATFSASEAEALDIWTTSTEYRGCAWNLNGTIAIIDGKNIESQRPTLPPDSSLLSTAEMAPLLKQLYGDHGVNGASNSLDPDDLAETADQLAEREKAFEREEKLTKENSSQVSPSRAIEKRVNVATAPPLRDAKTGKKRIQLTSMTSQSNGVSKTENTSSETKRINLTSENSSQDEFQKEQSGEKMQGDLEKAGNSSRPETSKTDISKVDSSKSNTGPAADEDCGKCKYCLDKPKFGGKNVLKQRCINRPAISVVAKRSVKTQNLPVDIDESYESSSSESGLSDDDWSDREFAADSDNDRGPYILSPFYETREALTNFLQNGRVFNVQEDASRCRSQVVCSRPSRERLWTYTVRGAVLAICSSSNIAVLATSHDELYVLHAASGVPTIMPIVLPSKCAFLEVLPSSAVAYCTRDGNLSILEPFSGRFLVNKVLLSPLVGRRGKPFALSSACEPGSKASSLIFSKMSIPLLIVADKGQSMANGYALCLESGTWHLLFDPQRHLGSEFAMLPPGKEPVQGETWRLQKRIFLAMEATATGVHAVQIMRGIDTSAMATVNHVESLVLASRFLKSEVETSEWLAILFNIFAKDFASFRAKAKQWLLTLESWRNMSQLIEGKLLPTLARTGGSYQGLVEEWNERLRDSKEN